MSSALHAVLDLFSSFYYSLVDSSIYVQCSNDFFLYFEGCEGENNEVTKNCTQWETSLSIKIKDFKLPSGRLFVVAVPYREMNLNFLLFELIVGRVDSRLIDVSIYLCWVLELKDPGALSKSFLQKNCPIL